MNANNYRVSIFLFYLSRNFVYYISVLTGTEARHK